MASVANQAVRNRINAQAYGSVNAGTIQGRAVSGRRTDVARQRETNATLRTIILALVASFIVFCVISAAMYAEKLQHDNNAIERNISSLEAEIDALNNQIAEGSNVSTIQEYATTKLGMVAPSSDNFVNLDNRVEEDKTTGLAAQIKKEAYK